MQRLVVALALLASAAGCGAGERAFEAADGPRLVLAEADVPEGFVEFDRGRQGRADASQQENVDPQRFGRLGGWKSRFRRPGGGREPGTVVIESKVDVFEDPDGAREEYRLLAERVGTSFAIADRRLGELAPGEEAVTGTVGQGAGEFATRFYVVAWRDANATVWLLVHGLEPVAFSELVELARAQEGRMSRARS